MMIYISYPVVISLVSVLWILDRILIWRKSGSISLKREAELLLVYICLIVVARFTFFPFFFFIFSAISIAFLLISKYSPSVKRVSNETVSHENSSLNDGETEKSASSLQATRN